MATGNTIGKLQYAPAPQGNVAAGSANPPKKKSWWSSYGDWVHTGLDVLGAVPIVGVVADEANAAMYTAEGDYGNAALSAASAAANFVPGGGTAFKAGKLAAKTTLMRWQMAGWDRDGSCLFPRKFAKRMTFCSISMNRDARSIFPVSLQGCRPACTAMSSSPCHSRSKVFIGYQRLMNNVTGCSARKRRPDAF